MFLRQFAERNQEPVRELRADLNFVELDFERHYYELFQ